MFGWWSFWRLRASWKNRFTYSSSDARKGASSLTATQRLPIRSRAL